MYSHFKNILENQQETSDLQSAMQKSRMQALEQKYSLLCKFSWKFLPSLAQFKEVTIAIISPILKVRGLDIFF